MTDGFDITNKSLEANEIAFDYLKGPDFRTMWVDGGFGGVTPSGQIQLALYSERLAIPRRQIFVVETEGASPGNLGQELLEKRISRGAIVRELSCDLRMNPDTAEILANWLLEQAAALRKEGKK